MSYKTFGITARLALANILLVTNALIWYYYIIIFLQENVSKITSDSFITLLIWSVHFAGIMFSALAGALLTRKFRERTFFLIFWMLLGVVSSLALMAVNPADVFHIMIISLIFGVSLGLGMPNCMGYYAEHTMVENRGRLGGIIMLISGLGMFLLGIIAVKGIEMRALILTFWRLFGLVIFLLIKPPETVKEKMEKQSYRLLFTQRSFILYLGPWIMFSLGAYLTVPIQFSILGKSLINFLMVIENIFIGIFAIVGGFLLDIVGRKRLAIMGFVVLGLGCSVLGIYPESIFSWYFYTVVDGIALGVLYVIFVVTIWGDLSHGMPSDKYYAVGVLPFFVSKYLQLTIGDYVAAVIPSYAIFSFIALFLFLAVVPLMYAPETLPEKAIRERELKSYIEHAKKVKEKYA